ncbi:uncharacterized protein N7483_012557 [Penicillium malachiteum]|uniref:uncharacterized protein n=1 Tax=Penicillium malachiteum TaxID=1324776 RepID=UPI002548C7E2|nr:uncharacterized protein N7483_012557 [Penicillium malachiteum]KAJ5715376.1 hypothetical protein N7483_012557 [Penicillium malachiteum]
MRTWTSTLALGWLIAPSPALSLSVGTKRAGSSNLCATNSRDIVSNDTNVWPWQSFKSSNITPPYLDINRTSNDLASGLLFISQEDESSTTETVKQESPFILTDDNELVWGGPQGETSNFRQQFWGDKSIITFWVGTGAAAYGANVGRGWGKVQFYDESYTLVKSVCLDLNLTLPEGTTADCDADVHESFITEDNTILLTAYNTTQADLTSVGGSKDGWVYDSIAVEVDLTTNEPVFIWSPLAHLAVNLTHEPYTPSNASEPFDWFHMNSIQKWGDHYLINSRHLWRTFLVNRQGEIVWYIDGQTGGDFGSLPQNGNFSWQHMARLRNDSSNPNEVLLSYFANDLDTGSATNPSKGTTLRLTLPPNPANPPKLETDFFDEKYPVSSAAEGSFTPLENGNTLMGYGDQPYIKEYDSTGKVLWSAQFAGEDLGQSYRAYKQEWSATPYYRPSLVVSKSTSEDVLSECAGASSSLRGYVSWNGATDVEGYKVYAGSSAVSLRLLGQIEKKGFETQFSLPTDTKVVQVAAVKSGRAVSKSEVVYV